jgi:hypothetical protein
MDKSIELQLLEMPIHSKIMPDNNIIILRVHTGWLYSIDLPNGNFSTTFVPETLNG